MPDSQNKRNGIDASGKDTFALITGASGGIGACFARALAARGRNLVLVARSKDKLEEVRNEITSRHSVRIEIIEQDLSSQGAARRLATTLEERGITVDL